jgi:hypothetical protein
MLSSRSIATLGIGFGASQVARIGLWPTGVIPPRPASVVPLGGGDYRSIDQRQTTKQRQAERERLGIVSADVERAIDVIARIEIRDPVAALENEQQAIAALATELEQEGILWNEDYARLLINRLRRLIDEELAWRLRALMDKQDEEQVILMLLTEM